MTGSGLTERLPRLLSLVPYLLARPGIPVADVAADFGIAERQLRRDLELLWMCGLPGYGPGDLIDLSFAGDTVTVTEDAGMRRPLRLTTAEATALLVALRTLGDVPGMVDTNAVLPRDGEDRAGRRGRGRRAAVAVEVSRQEQATTAAIREGAGDGPGADDPLLHRGPRRRHPRAPSTRCGCCSSRAAATSRRGAGARGRCACSGSTAWTTSPCSTNPPPPRRTPSRPTCRRACSRRAPSTAARCCCSSRTRAGWPSTTRWSRWSSCPPSRPTGGPGMITAPGATAGPGCCCATPTRPGWCGWCWGWAGERGSSSRPSWPRRWRGGRRRRWPGPTDRTDGNGTGAGR